MHVHVCGSHPPFFLSVCAVCSCARRPPFLGRPGPKGCSPCGCTGPPKFWGPKISNSPLSSIATCLLPTCPNVQMLKLKPMTRPAHDCPVPTTACSLSRLLCCCVPIHLLIFNSTDSRLPDSPSFQGPAPCRCRGRPPTEARRHCRRPTATGEWATALRAGTSTGQSRRAGCRGRPPG